MHNEHVLIRHKSEIPEILHVQSLIIVQEQILIGGQIRKIVQHILQKRFDLTRWWNEPSGTSSGTMWFQIVVSVKFYRPLYMMGARLSWPEKS